MNTVQINVNGQQLILDINVAKKLNEKTFAESFGDLYGDNSQEAFKALQKEIEKTDVKKG
jgi:DNA-binding protein YbaB